MVTKNFQLWFAFAVASAMKIDVADLKKESKRRNQKQTAKGPPKGKVQKVATTSKPAFTSKSMPKTAGG